MWALRLRTEETEGRADPVLAGAVGRVRWGLSHVVVAVVGTTYVQTRTLEGLAFAAGYLTSAALGLIGLKRRGLLRQGWVLLLMPLHWLLLSIAAWRALWQLLLNPFHWEKTAHGLARTSRLAGDSL